VTPDLRGRTTAALKRRKPGDMTARLESQVTAAWARKALKTDDPVGRGHRARPLSINSQLRRAVPWLFGADSPRTHDPCLSPAVICLQDQISAQIRRSLACRVRVPLGHEPFGHECDRSCLDTRRSITVARPCTQACLYLCGLVSHWRAFHTEIRRATPAGEGTPAVYQTESIKLEAIARRRTSKAGRVLRGERYPQPRLGACPGEAEKALLCLGVGGGGGWRTAVADGLGDVDGGVQGCPVGQ
jgi:hypothetical protein